jgi:hypothetical protein
MLKNNLKNKFYTLMLILFAIIFVVWVLFFILINSYINTSTQSQLDNTAAQIMNDLDKEFTHVEQLVFTLRQSPTVKSFVSDQDITSFYQKSAAVDKAYMNTSNINLSTSSLPMINSTEFASLVEKILKNRFSSVTAYPCLSVMPMMRMNSSMLGMNTRFFQIILAS